MSAQENHPQTPPKGQRSSRAKSGDTKQQAEQATKVSGPLTSHISAHLGEQRDVLASERMEEYKAVLQNHAAIHARRQSTTNVFVSLNVVFLTAIGFLLVSSHLNSWWVVIAVAVINVAILPMNVIWYRILNRYQYNHAKYIRYLREIEEEFEKRWGNPNSPEVIGIYRRVVDPVGFLRVGTSQLERMLSIYFLILYPAIIVVAGILVYLVNKQVIPPLILS